MKDDSITSVKQSHRLMQLGLNPKSADFGWQNVNIHSPIFISEDEFDEYRFGDYISPAWSKSRLLEIICQSLASKEDYTIKQRIYIEAQKNKITYSMTNELDYINLLCDFIEWLISNGCLRKTNIPGLHSDRVKKFI